VVSKDRRLDAGGRQPRLRTYPFVSPFVTNGYYRARIEVAL
jgi:hypothetical protein